MKICKKCHRPNPDDANFCAWCRNQEFDNITNEAKNWIKTNANKVMIAGVVLVVIGIAGFFIKANSIWLDGLTLRIYWELFKEGELSIFEFIIELIGVYRYGLMLIGGLLTFIGYSERKK